MNLDEMSTQLLYTTVPIWAEKEDGSTSQATAFYFDPVRETEKGGVPLLVTNHHVLDGATRAVVEVIRSVDGRPQPSERIRIGFEPRSWVGLMDQGLDVAAMPIGPSFNELTEQRGWTPFFRSVSHDLIPDADTLRGLAAMEEIIFIGYPSGIRDNHAGTPLFRRGITSTPPWSDFEGRPVFLVDAGVFKGSSGSPVFIFNQGTYTRGHDVVVGTRLLFMGLITDTIIRIEESAEVPLGLGRVTRADVVQDFLRQGVERLIGGTNE